MKQYAALNDTLYFWFAANDTSGSGGDGASPAADIRLAGAAADAAPVYSPMPVLLTHANYPAGAHEIAIAATAANGFAVNNTYAVFCTLAIDSQNPTGFIGSFDLKPIEAQVKGLDAAAIDSIFDEVVEGTLTFRQIQRIKLAALGGKSTGGGTTGLKFRDNADSKDRISATVDSQNNRTAMTLDGT